MIKLAPWVGLEPVIVNRRWADSFSSMLENYTLKLRLVGWVDQASDGRVWDQVKRSFTDYG